MPHFLAARAPRLPHGSAAVLAALLALAACGDKAPPSGPPPPPEVGVVTVAPRTLDVPTELPGRVEASRVAQVRARVTGIVQKRLFAEGSDVKAGQTCCSRSIRRPTRPPSTARRRARARRRPTSSRRPACSNRYKPLLEANADQQAGLRQRPSRPQQTPRPTSPPPRPPCRRRRSTSTTPPSPRRSAGRIGRRWSPKARWSARARRRSWPLIQQIDPIYVNFTQSTTDMLALRKRRRQRQVQARRALTIPACASRSKTAAIYRSPASCCSPT